ncbi:MAG: amidohydrolase [Chloroflexi bacterium]|nr:amidohydrolase [Chloroflexota bacterium]
MAARPAIIDADGHYMERQQDVKKYLKPPWDKRDTALLASDQPWDSDLFGTLMEPKLRGLSARDQLDAWLAIMDRENFERAILFPTGFGGVAKLQERKYGEAVAQAFNDFVAEEFNRRSDRVHAVGVLPLRDPEAAAKELRRCVTELGVSAFEIITTGMPVALGDPSMDPVWAEAEKVGAAMCIHGTRGHAYELGGDKLRTFAEVHCYAFAAGLMLQFTSIVFNGVPVRFPKLKLAFLEVGVSWLPYYLDRMDEHWEKRGEFETPDLKRKPSAVVRDASIWFSVEAGETLLPQTIDYLGDQHFLYASDIPHWDNEFPHSLEQLWNHAQLSDTSKQRILHDNAAELYETALAPKLAAAR